MSKQSRDPRLNPETGDIWRSGDRFILIHFVDSTMVYFGPIAPKRETIPLTGWRSPRAAFAAQLLAEGGEFMTLETFENWEERSE